MVVSTSPEVLGKLVRVVGVLKKEKKIGLNINVLIVSDLKVLNKHKTNG